MPEIIERRISFNGGELSPWTDPRLDLEKYRNSCRTLENFRPNVYGGAFSRAGTVFIAEQDHPEGIGRVVPFEFSATTNLILLFTDELIRVWTTGATPAMPVVDASSTVGTWGSLQPYTAGQYVEKTGTNAGIYYCLVSHGSVTFATDLADGNWELATEFKIATPYAAADLAALQFEQLNDRIFISHPSYAPRVLSRLANNKWSLELLALEYPPLRDENITASTIGASAVTGLSITLTASTSTFAAGHVGSRWLITHRRDEPSVELGIKTAVTVGTASDALFVLGEWSCSLVAAEGTSNWNVTAVIQRSTDKSTWETIRTIAGSRLDQSGLITGTEIDPCWLRILKTVEDGTPPTNGSWKLEAIDPDHHGIVEIIGFTSATSVSAQVIFELGATAATTKWNEAAWSDFRGWPRSVCIHETRLFFGGNSAQPQTIWGSVIDDFGNFRTGSDDDLGLAFTLAGQKANAVQWLVSQEALIIGTSGAEGPMGSRESDKALTPTNAKAGRFTQTGSAHIRAIPVQDAVIFVQRSGRKAWEFAFAFESDGYKANDLTLLAEHVTDGGITGISLQRNPESVLWAVTGDGTLLGLSYDRAQSVAGWCRYVTDGFFESVAVVGGAGEEDEIWVTVRRTVDGDTVRYLERFQPDRMRLLKDGDAEQIVSADAAVIYDSTPATTITGLDHLEGEEVTVLADGAPVGLHTVTGGEITLDTAASVVIAGLPFTATLEPTFLETGDPGSLSKVAWKRIHRVHMELWKSLGAEVTADAGANWERVQFAAQGVSMDEALPLFTGYKDAHVTSRSERQASVKIRQTQPLPLNILSLHIRHEMNTI
jgi:hypothetical protein